ncbi:MAG: hypothetical protein IJ734_04235, partial [Fibrobacter sp.]|nr:hypothetical protein [Fibrobacter sp.]
MDTPYGAFDSDYPYLDSENKSLILKPENFAKSWEQYGFSGYNDERVKLVSAVALKFQRVGRTVDTDYSFKIKKIKYNLAQLPSFRFMPRDDSFALIVFNEDGGRVVVDGLKGIVDGDNPKIVRYPLWEAKYLSFKVFISSGYELSEVSYSTISDNPLFRLPLYPSVYSNFFVKTEMIESENKYSVSNFFVGQDIYLYVKYKPCSRKQHLVTPFYTKNEKFLKPGGDAANATISAVYSDGFGSTAQIQKRVDEKKFSVSSKYKNSFGQVTKNPMAFVRHDDDDDFKYVDVACEQCVVKANEYFVGRDEYVDPNAEGYAYAETNYFNADEGLIFEAAGIAENSFERSRNSSEEKIAKVWKMPAKDNNDYIDFNLLDDVHLAGIYVNSKKEGGQFILNVEKNAQGVFSQKIYNSKGQNETSWTYDGTNVLISYNTFDIYGNVVESGIKGYEKLSTTFKYDAQNRLISSKNSDRGETEIFYDSHGRDRLVRTAQLKAEGEYNYLAKVYDSQGRIVATGISRGFDFKNNFDQKIPEENFKLITRSMYGKLTEDSLTQFGVDYDLAHNLVPFLKDFRSNDESAIIAFDEDQKYTKISIVGYDNLGRVINRWVLYGLEGVPPIQLNFSYNTSDEIVESVFSEWIDGAWVERVKRKRTYDSKGRLEWIYDNDIPLASYTYALNGNVRSKKYYFGKDSYVEKIIHRDVYGRVINIEYVD